MPQLKPYRWINLISWTVVLLSLGTLIHQLILFPLILRTHLSRIRLLMIS